MRGSGKILLVDDDEDLRNAYQLFLETNDFTVSWAGSTAEVLRVMRTEQFNVVLLDIFLDQEDGLELLKAIVAAHVRLPVIIMSGLSGQHDLFQKALDSGAAGVFTKWLPLDALLTEVHRVMEMSGR
jgi:DNA-binding NtrC family response regulator